MGASAGVPYARTLNKLPITGRFSDLRFTERTLPIQKEQWDNSFRPPDISGLTLTAARPPRIFTVFPFHTSNPTGRTCNQIFHFKRTNAKYQSKK
jgi:hypothetical protein